jgi:hypothetical protein
MYIKSVTCVDIFKMAYNFWPILSPLGLRQGPCSLVQRIAGSNPLRAWIFALGLCSVILCRYRPWDGLITRPRSPTVCRELIKKPSDWPCAPKGETGMYILSFVLVREDVSIFW